MHGLTPFRKDRTRVYPSRVTSSNSWLTSFQSWMVRRKNRNFSKTWKKLCWKMHERKLLEFSPTFVDLEICLDNQLCAVHSMASMSVAEHTTWNVPTTSVNIHEPKLCKFYFQLIFRFVHFVERLSKSLSKFAKEATLFLVVDMRLWRCVLQLRSKNGLSFRWAYAERLQRGTIELLQIRIHRKMCKIWRVSETFKIRRKFWSFKLKKLKNLQSEIFWTVQSLTEAVELSLTCFSLCFHP